MPLDFLHFSVWVSSNNRELACYEAVVNDGNSTSCYIPSEVGEEFEINWYDASPFSSSVVACYMDGRPMSGMPSHPGLTGCNECVYTSMHKLRPFRFSAVELTDDDDVADPDGVSPDLGCIQIEIHRTERHFGEDTHRDRRGDVQEVGPVHERSKKLGSHCVSLGPEQERHVGHFLAPRYLDDEPYAVFRFIYRSRELLIARGIIPPSTLNMGPDVKPDISAPGATEAIRGRMRIAHQQKQSSRAARKKRSHANVQDRSTIMTTRANTKKINEAARYAPVAGSSR